MKTNKLLNLISVLLITTLLGNMLLLPGTAQAQPQAVPPAVASVVAGGERFMDAAPQALGRALQLAQRLDYISQVELADLSETTLIQARQDALATAEQAATAQGSVGAIANGLTELDYQVQAAANMSTEVADLESSGFDAELETALADLGLTSGQIGALEDEAAANFTVRGSPLPAETVTLLQEAGLNQAEIDEIEATLTDYGLANNTLADRLAQFRASQEELSLVRTQALVAYLQLLTKQVFVRQLAGETSRELTAAEVDEVVKDQLRLLIHLGYLDNLWNGNPDPNVGEGQWLFVERYSLRVAERLDALILDTQNLGLIVDLLVALQIHSTALAALAGDADYAQAEVEPLADFLETMLGDNLPGSQGYRHAAPPFWWGSALAMGDYNPAVLSGYEPEVAPEAVAVAQEQAQERIKGLAYPLWFQGSGDPDPSNNQAEMIFHTAPPLLPPGVMEILNQVMGGSTPLEFVWEVLTGESENWWAIGGNIVLSFVPIAGELLDLLTLFTDPTIWGKAMSLIGLVASLLSDGAEILTAVGIVVPPALAALPAAVGAEAVDVGAAILKNVRRLVSADVFGIIKNIPFDEALQLGGDVLGQLAKRAVAAVGGVNNWPGSIDEVFSLIQNVLGSVWEPFTALVKHYGATDLGKLFTLGFGEGSFLAGRVLKQGAALSDEAINTLVKIGDDLGKAGVELSDNAVGGLGKLANSLPEGHLQGIVKNLCPGGVTQIVNYRVRGLASPLRQEVCNINFQKILENVVNLDEAGLDGFKKLATQAHFTDNELAELLIVHADDRDTLNSLLRVVVDSQHINWNSAQTEVLGRLIKNSGGLTANALKHVPLNSLDETLYPGFSEFLIESAADTESYLSKNLTKINDLAAQGQVDAVRGHIANLVGEFREKQFAEYANENGIMSLFNHSGPVNEAGLDGLARKGNTFFLTEIKDRGLGVGTIANGSKSGDRLSPNELQNYMIKGTNGYQFNRQYFLDRLGELADNGIIGRPLESQIRQAAGNGQLEIIVFAGGRPDPFTSTLNNIMQLINPLSTTNPIKIRLIIDNF